MRDHLALLLKEATMEEKGITQEIAESYDTNGPMYRTAITFNTGDRPKAEIQKDILEEIGHIKNLGFRDFRIGFHNVVDDKAKDHIIYDLHINYAEYDEILYLNGVMFIHYNIDEDNVYHKKLLTPVSLEPNDAASKNGIIQFVDTMMDNMFSLILTSVLTKEEIDNYLDSDCTLENCLTEEQLIKLGTEIAPKFRVIFTADEDILNSNPIVYNEKRNNNSRMKYLYSDNGYFSFKNIVESLPGASEIREEFKFSVEGDIGKGIQRVLDLMMKPIPMMVVEFEIDIPEERRHLFNDYPAIGGAIFLSLIRTHYQHFKENPIVYAIDNCGQTVPGSRIGLLYDLLSMKDNITKAVKSTCSNILKQAHQMDPDGGYKLEDINMDIVYSDPSAQPEEQAKQLYMKTSKQVEDEYRKENPNYDKRKLFN